MNRRNVMRNAVMNGPSTASVLFVEEPDSPLAATMDENRRLQSSSSVLQMPAVVHGCTVPGCIIHCKLLELECVSDSNRPLSGPEEKSLEVRLGLFSKAFGFRPRPVSSAD